jgi:hypothetical protein
MHVRLMSVLAAVICLAATPAPTARAEDDQAQADVGGGSLEPRTRHDHATERGRYVFQDGIDTTVFRIAQKKGAAGGALECVDVLPRRGRIFFPAQGNLAFDADGWSGAASVWLNTNPNTLLKTPYCDPLQITHKGAHDGGIWTDFPDSKPRDMRMGIFPSLAAGEKPLDESDPEASIVRLRRVPFESGQWHHVVLNWDHFDTGEANARARLYVDGRLIGEVKNRALAMKWDIEQTGVYFAVNYIGLLDELALFDRSLSENEIAQLYKDPAWLNRRKGQLDR